MVIDLAWKIGFLGWGMRGEQRVLLYAFLTISEAGWAQRRGDKCFCCRYCDPVIIPKNEDKRRTSRIVCSVHTILPNQTIEGT